MKQVDLEERGPKVVGGVGILGFVFLILFVLKLLGKISCSWWIVTLPLWGPPVAIAGIVLAALIAFIGTVVFVMILISWLD